MTDLKPLTVVFEDISLTNFNLFKKFVRDGHPIRVFDFDFKIKKKKFLLPYLEKGQLERIPILNSFDVHGQSIDLAQQLLPFVQRSGVYRDMVSLFNSEDVSFLCRKALAEDIFKFSFIHAYLKANAPQHAFIFIPKQFVLTAALLERELNIKHELPTTITVQHHSSEGLSEFGSKIVYKAAAVVYVGCKALGCIVGALLTRQKYAQEQYDYAFFVNSRYEIERVGDRGYDFLIDNDQFNVDKSIFITNSRIDTTLLDRERLKGRKFFDLKERLSFNYLLKYRWDLDFFKKLGHVLIGLWTNWKDPGSLGRVYFIGVQKYCDWHLVWQQIAFKQFLFTNQENIQMSAINILLKGKSVETWNYACFLGGGYLYAQAKRFDKVRHVLWSFLVYDHFIGFNHEVGEYYKAHYQQVKQYHPTGSLYAQLVHQQMTPERKSQFWKHYFPQLQRRQEHKIIAVFDTTFIDASDCWTSLDDGLHFYQDMLRVLNSNDNYVMIFKPSKSPTYYSDPKHPGSSPKGKQLVDLWHQFKSHPRVAWPIALDLTPSSFLDFSLNNVMMACADVVITHCMSSPTAEALGAGQKAFWYESSHKHQGIDYDLIPGLIVHGYSALEQRLKSVLGMNDDMHQQYLNEFIKGTIDEHVDGKAMSRFKNLLIQAKT